MADQSETTEMMIQRHFCPSIMTRRDPNISSLLVNVNIKLQDTVEQTILSMDNMDDALRPEWVAFGNKLGFFPKIHGPTYDDIVSQDTKNGEAMTSKFTFPGPDPSVAKSEHKTASNIRLKSYKPDTYQPGQPLVYYIHGGGFVLGSVDQDDRFCDVLSKANGSVFVSVEYRLAPEHVHPAPLDDTVEGAKWCIKNARSLGAREGPIVILGKSAGGSLVFATALRLIDEGRGKDILGIVPCQPLTIHPNAVPGEFKSRYTAYDENAENTVNTKNGMLAFYDLHAAPLDDPYIWCLLHKNLKALPRTYMNACGADTLRDDARMMRELLDRNGVKNQYHEYAKLPHYFYAFPGADMDELRNEYLQRTAKGIRWAMHLDE